MSLPPLHGVAALRAELARLGHQVPASTLARWVQQGRILPVRRMPGRNGARLFDRADVALLAEQLTTERSAAA